MLLRFATKSEKILLAVGIVCALVSGALQPMLPLLFGSLTNTLGSLAYAPMPKAQYDHDVIKVCWQLGVLGTAMAIACFLYLATWEYVAECTTHRLREAYLRAVLRQDIAFFDHVGGGSVATAIVTSCRLVQDGSGEKVPMLFMNLATFIAAFGVAFSQDARLSGIMITIIPAMALSVGFLGFKAGAWENMNLKAYNDGGDVAESAYSSIRVLSSFMAFEKLASAYDVYLRRAQRYGVWKSAAIAGLFACISFIMCTAYSLCFHVGGKYVAKGSLLGGDVLTVFFSVVIGSFALTTTSFEIQAINTARSAAADLFHVIDRVPVINSESNEGFTPTEVIGHISVKQVDFAYPSRPDVTVLKGMTLDIAPGTTCALVGSSGSGKSTIVALLERFYNPLGGSITLDGVPIQDLQVKWLRQQMGYVTQEPVLFKGTLAQNIAHGLVGTDAWSWPPERQMELIVKACQTANAHNFIVTLPMGYDTLVGERGFLLSGGQRQRVAIARAIVRDPKILLLDEATSALDTISERVVSQALAAAAKGRTTIVIAHRLSTIRDADQIIVMDKGVVVERGNHASLIAQNGFYKRLVDAQEIQFKGRVEEAEEAEDAEAEAGLPAETTASQKKGLADAAQIQSGDDHTAVVTGKLLTKSQRAQAKKMATPEEPYVTSNGRKLMLALIRLGAPEWPLTVLGLISSIVVGGQFPVLSILFGSVLGVLFMPNSTADEQRALRHEANLYALYFFILALICGVATFSKIHSFGVASERLTRRLRLNVFLATMRQSVGWFDRDQHSSGILVSNLSNDPQSVQVLSGTLMGSIIEFMTNIIAGVVIALIFNWRLGLISTAFLPIEIWVNKARNDIMTYGNQATKVYYENSAQVACEAVSAARTVAVLTREQDVCDNYHEDLRVPLAIGKRSAVRASAVYSFTRGFQFWQGAVMFRVGAHWLYPRADGTTVGGLDLRSFFVCFLSGNFVAMAAGQIFSFTPNLEKAFAAAQSIFRILRSVPPIDSFSDTGKILDPTSVKGHIRFENIQFRYPTRPDVKVLKGVDLEVKPGQFIALVGSSGCGKSTSIQLCERFYDPTGGRVTLDGVDIREFNLRSYRSVIGLVSQEPNLYEMTIRENILLGQPTGLPASEADVIQAAKDANVHDFITSLPQGYDTPLTNRGGGLSGGQKQRIAIARALIRQPRVLLLDEATSALSSEDEAKISKVLEQAAKGRTTISIAHRLSSIQHADRIYLFMNGRIKEQGTHDELLALGGEYHALALQQSLA
ncbi:hypothetical protein CXG81DRAFT_13030 [Caulochytrium protostelioides]|uniref:ABC transporter n=1 Tax=Caulochytrium protostelioides TaxID=1555241 RepID=A0A4P9WWK4_9FUNG|nr:ABC transporter [Caulochytrium protostelioides]RKP00596.1 hypothetical protein CXG81DRAFT_13030 [Caulochytrium protostelioides]|eukprot:RKP00596.1 hypothetical protein CXG81DRAFT_13030 [Caulochytrium protostelioides]